MIDIKPPEEEKEDYMLSPNIDTRWKGLFKDVEDIIYENKDLAHDDYVSLQMRTLINISYLLEEGREYAYMAHHYAKPMKEINETLKDILKEMRERKV